MDCVRGSAPALKPHGLAPCALEGIRVLDMSRVLAGPYCSMNLGDLGAEIIKIERPGTGDDTRAWGPPYVKDESCYFLSINRNKRSVCIDMQTVEGQDILKKLAKESDVLIENFLPGKLSKYGLGYDQIKEIAPHIVYCSITGYGQTGPYKERAGYDVVASAMGGLVHITGPAEGDPCKVGVAVTDITSGLYACSSILAALISRGRTGKGQHIDVNLLSSQVAVISHIASNYLNAGQEARRYGTQHASIVPYQAFQTADGYMIVGAGNDNLFRKACEVWGMPDLPDDPKYKTNADRVRNRDGLLGTIGARMLEKTTSEWLKLFEHSGAPFGPINNMQQVFSDPQVLHNNMIQTMEHPSCGEIRVPGPPVKYSETKTVLQCPPPLLGEHTKEVLLGILGYSLDEVEELAARGVVQLSESSEEIAQEEYDV